MKVGNIVDFQVLIHHAIFWVLCYCCRCHLVEGVTWLCQDTVVQLILRVPVFQPADATGAQGCIQNTVGTDHAARIASGKAEVDCYPRYTKSIDFIGQDDAALRISFLLSMVVESVYTVAIPDEEAGLARRGQKSLAHDLEEDSYTDGRSVEDVHDVGANTVRLGTDMGDPDRLRQEKPADRR